MALAYFAGNFSFRAALDWGLGKIKFGKLEYDPRKGSFKITDDGIGTLGKYNSDIANLTKKINDLNPLDDVPNPAAIQLAQQLNNTIVNRRIAVGYSSLIPLLNFGFEYGAASTDINAGDLLDKATVNVIRLLYGEELEDSDWKLDEVNDKPEDYAGVTIKAGKNTVASYIKFLSMLGR